jgi:serine/threonine protein kinase
MGGADQASSAFEECNKGVFKNSQCFKSQDIDGCYRILKRFSDSTEACKMVFHCKDLRTGAEVVVKVYTEQESNSFLEEVAANEKLPDSPLKAIKMIKFVAARENMPIFEYLEHFIETYSYIVLPICKKGTLLDLLMNACQNKYKLSTGAQQYLSWKLVESLI